MFFESFKNFFLVLFFVLLYLAFGTGVYTDDYTQIRLSENFQKLSKVFLPNSLFLTWLSVPLAYFVVMPFYFLFGFEYLLGYDFFKGLIGFICIFLTYQFAKDYFSKDRAIIFSLVYFLIPIRDTSFYVFLILTYSLTSALIFYSHYLIRRDKYFAGFLSGAAGAFTMYASPPFSIGLAFIFLYERSFKKFFFFLMPIVLYIIYYFLIGHFMGLTKISNDITFVSFFKAFLLQVITYMDSGFLLSFWLKILYSILANGISTAIFSFLFSLFFLAFVDVRSEKIPWNLLWGILVVLISAFGIFALTGLYPQMSFNLGNRVMIFGSLLIAFVVSSLPFNKIGFSIVIVFFFLSVFGNSLHWKEWNDNQLKVIEQIKLNPNLATLKEGDLLLVSGNGYSSLGPFSNIEFFAEAKLHSIFSLATGKEITYSIQVINDRFSIDQKSLLDKKYGFVMNLPERFYLYDSEIDKVESISIEQLERVLSTFPKVKRHWFQLIENESAKSALLFFMPRLRYLF